MLIPAEIQYLGTTPYQDLKPEERSQLALAGPEAWAQIGRIAADQQPPNVTTLSAVSALCLSVVDDYASYAAYRTARVFDATFEQVANQ